MTAYRTTFDRTHMSATLKAFYDYLDAAPELLQDAENVTVSHLAATALPVDAYQILLTTDGAGIAAQVAQLPNPASNGIIGQRHLLKCASIAHATDTVSVDKTYLYNGGTITAVALTTAGAWLLVEHRGAHWTIIDSSTGVVT
jgi:hypothetical protein